MEMTFRIDCGDIYLQEFDVVDADKIFEISNQPEIYTYLPDWKSTKEQRIHWVTQYEIPENKAFLKALERTSDVAGYGFRLGVFVKETNELVGWCCTFIKAELPVPNREIMYAISSKHQGKGYATEASKALIDFLFINSNVEVLNTIALTHNIPSNKVIEKCGFTYFGEQTIEQELFNHYQLHKSDWARINNGTSM